MKVIILLSVIFVSVLGDELVFDRDSNGEVPQGGRVSPMPWRTQDVNQKNRLSGTNRGNLLTNQDSDDWVQEPRRNGDASQDTNVLTPDVLSALLLNRPNSPRSNSNSAAGSSLGYWATNPDAAAFDAKIKARLDSSRILADKLDIRRKLTELAEEKFDKCKDLVEDRQRACLGRSTGQVMQLVAAVENMHRNSQ